MQKLLETIKIIDGQALFLPFHQARFDQTRNALFHCQTTIHLKDFIQPPSQTGVYKCRLIYTTHVECIEYFPYQERKFRRLQLVYDDDIQYPFKYLQRDQLNQLVELKRDADDIIIVKQGLVTDTSIANIAFWQQNKWVTPCTPLLCGTTRQRLLAQHVIEEQEIKAIDLWQFTGAAMMNALLGFHIIEQVEFID